jgi:hypothetical protein
VIFVLSTSKFIENYSSQDNDNFNEALKNAKNRNIEINYMNLSNSRFDREINDGALFCTRPYEFDIWKTFSAPYVKLILNLSN